MNYKFFHLVFNLEDRVVDKKVLEFDSYFDLLGACVLDVQDELVARYAPESHYHVYYAVDPSWKRIPVAKILSRYPSCSRFC